MEATSTSSNQPKDYDLYTSPHALESNTPDDRFYQ